MQRDRLGVLGGDPSSARIASGAGYSRPASLPGRWCGIERATDDTSHAVTDAPRVKVVYAYPPGGPNRFQLLKDLIQQDVAQARSAVARASGGTKTIRFDVGTGCPGRGAPYVDIQSIALPKAPALYGYEPWSASAGMWSDLRRELGLRGRWNVIAYVDFAGLGLVDGIASQPLDDSPGSTNDANRGGQHGFVLGDGSAEFSPNRFRVFLHEILHTLGAVQDGAPHATGKGHCFDGADVMCYEDGGLQVPEAWQGRSCPGALTVDCGNDDYLAARPARGSYLATHWNLVDSAFMCDVATCDAPDSGPSVRTALSNTARALTQRLRRAGLPGLLGKGRARVAFDAPRPGRLRLTVGAAGHGVLVGRRAIRRAGRATISARSRPPAGRIARAARLRVVVRLSFTSGGRRHSLRRSTLLVRR